jgi:hypothetical protein
LYDPRRSGSRGRAALARLSAARARLQPADRLDGRARRGRAGGDGPGARHGGVLALAVSLFYVGGMFLNDAFDREVDARERPERPIPAGEVAAAEVFLIGFGMLGAGWVLVGVAADGSASALLGAAALAGAIVLYDVWHKGNPFGPALMGICRALVYMTAALAVSRGLSPPVIAGALVLLSYLIGLTYVAKQESLGRVRNLWPLVCLAAPLVYAGPAAARGVAGAVLFGGLLIWIVLSLAPRAPGEGSQRTVSDSRKTRMRRSLSGPLGPDRRRSPPSACGSRCSTRPPGVSSFSEMGWQIEALELPWRQSVAIGLRTGPLQVVSRCRPASLRAHARK